MGNNRTNRDVDEADELLMNDDIEFFEEDVDDDQDDKSSRNRAFNLDMRHRIEDRLAAKQLEKELNEYDFFDLEDDDTLH